MSIFELQQKLIQAWTSKNVDQAYQNTFLSNADSITEQMAKKIMQEEVSRVRDGRSMFEEILGLKKKRAISLAALEQGLKNKEEPLSDKDVRQLCLKVDQLRRANLQLVEKCLELGRGAFLKQLETFQTTNNASSSHQYTKVFSQSYGPLFSQINQDNKIIKNSVLQNYIDCSEDFDPFIMKQYQNIKSYELPAHQEVKKMYNFGLSLSYRYIKTKKDMQECLKQNVRQKWQKKSSPVLIKKDKISKPDSDRRKNSSPVMNQTKYTQIKFPKLSLGKIQDAHNDLMNQLKQTERKPKPKRKQRISIVILDKQYQKSPSQLLQKKWNSFTFGRESTVTNNGRNSEHDPGVASYQSRRPRERTQDGQHGRYIEQVEQEYQNDGLAPSRRIRNKKIRQLQPLNPSRSTDYDNNQRPNAYSQALYSRNQQQTQNSFQDQNTINYNQEDDYDQDEVDRYGKPIKSRNKNFRKAVPRVQSKTKTEPYINQYNNDNYNFNFNDKSQSQARIYENSNNNSNNNIKIRRGQYVQPRKLRTQVDQYLQDRIKRMNKIDGQQEHERSHNYSRQYRQRHEQKSINREAEEEEQRKMERRYQAGQQMGENNPNNYSYNNTNASGIDKSKNKPISSTPITTTNRPINNNTNKPIEKSIQNTNSGNNSYSNTNQNNYQNVAVPASRTSNSPSYSKQQYQSQQQHSRKSNPTSINPATTTITTRTPNKNTTTQHPYQPNKNPIKNNTNYNNTSSITNNANVNSQQVQNQSYPQPSSQINNPNNKNRVVYDDNNSNNHKDYDDEEEEEEEKEEEEHERDANNPHTKIASNNAPLNRDQVADQTTNKHPDNRPTNKTTTTPTNTTTNATANRPTNTTTTTPTNTTTNRPAQRNKTMERILDQLDQEQPGSNDNNANPINQKNFERPRENNLSSNQASNSQNNNPKQPQHQIQLKQQIQNPKQIQQNTLRNKNNSTDQPTYNNNKSSIQQNNTNNNNNGSISEKKSNRIEENQKVQDSARISSNMNKHQPEKSNNTSTQKPTSTANNTTNKPPSNTPRTITNPTTATTNQTTKPVDNNSNKIDKIPDDKPMDINADRPIERNTNGTNNKPQEVATNGNMSRPTDKANGNVTDKPVQRRTDQSENRPVQKVQQREKNDQPAQKSINKPVNKQQNKPAIQNTQNNLQTQPQQPQQMQKQIQQPQLQKKPQQKQQQKQQSQASTQKKQAHPQQPQAPTKKQIKIMPGKNLTTQKISQFLSTRKIDQAYTSSFLGPSFQHSLQNQNVYYVQFLANNKLSVFTIASACNNDDYTIRLWAPIVGECSESENVFLFKKYVSYLEKFTMLKRINVEVTNGGGEMGKILEACGFSKSGNGLYSAKRISPITKSLDFPSFFSAEFSTISFHHEQYTHCYLYSQQIQPMSASNSYTNPSIPYLTIPNPPQHPQVSSTSTLIKKPFKIATKLADYKELNSFLENEGYDDYEFEENMGLNDMGVAMMKSHVVLGGRASHFMTQDGSVFVDGHVMKIGGAVLAEIQCLVEGYGVYIVKGVDSCSKAAHLLGQNLSNFSTKGQKQKIGIKMFSKLLYGRLFWDQSTNAQQIFRQTNYGCYGNWQLNLAWQQLLQGKITHQVNNFTKFGDKDGYFYYALSYQGQILFCFKVEPSNSVF